MSATVELDLTSAYETLVGGPCRIPVEIWRCIFNLCLPHEWGVDFAARRALDELGPWAIVAVCSHWQKIALDMPELWSTFKIGPARYNPARFNRRPIALSIERARGAPLSLTLDSSMSHFPHRVPGLIPWKQVQNLAIVNSSTDKRLGVRFDLPSILGQCTELRTIDICHHDEESDLYLHLIRRTVLPCLRQMDLGSATLIAHGDLLHAPVIQALGMTVHDFRDAPRNGIISFLKHSGNKLQQLQVQIAPQKHHENLPSFLEKCLAALPNLQQLDIYLPGVSFQGEILWLQKCRLPKLETLRVFYAECAATVKTSGLFEQLQSLSCRMSPDLKEFVLSFAGFEAKAQLGIQSVATDKGSKVEVLQLEDGLKATLIFNVSLAGGTQQVVNAVSDPPVHPMSVVSGIV